MSKPRIHPEVPASEAPTRVRYQVLAWLTAAAALSYLSRNAVGVAESTIREGLNLTLQQSGWFMGAFFWTYGIFQVPGGWLAHRQGTRWALACFALLWSLATLMIGLAPGLWILISAQLLMGAAQAGNFPASCLSISHWMPIARRSLACGILITGMQMGAITAGTLTGILLENTTWRVIFVLYSLPGILWVISFWRRFRDDPVQARNVNQAEWALIRDGRNLALGEESHGPTPWRKIVRSFSVWLLSGQQICRSAGYVFFVFWFPTFLQETRGISVKDSGYLQALVFTGTLLGGLLGGGLADMILRRTNSLRLSRSGVGALFLLGCAILIVAAWFVETTWLAIALLTLGSLFAALAGPCAFSASIDIGGRYTPQVFGIMNMMGNFSAAACPVLVGAFFAWTANWNLVLLFFAGIYLTGALCWVLIDPGKRVEA